jgi:hypothetical protein
METQEAMPFEGIKTDAGNALLKRLVEEGWRVVSEYPDSMFDKGIDFDFYTLKRADRRIRMEWTNWEEWKITGPADVMDEIREWQRRL